MRQVNALSIVLYLSGNNDSDLSVGLSVASMHSSEVEFTSRRLSEFYSLLMYFVFVFLTFPLTSNFLLEH